MNKNDNKTFKKKCLSEILKQSKDKNFLKLSNDWLSKSVEHNYSYHFEWLGRPVIQYPQDLILIQQIIWKVKPDLIIETGIARGGSLLFSASILELLSLYNINKKSKVLGIDIDIRKHNLKEIKKSPLYKRISLIQGSSVEKIVKDKVKKITQNFKNILVFLDSNHTHNHVLEELNFYSTLVTKNSYCVVFDTVISKLNDKFHTRKAWNSNENPYTAVEEFLRYIKKKRVYDINNKLIKFSIDNFYENQAMITVAPKGFLLRK
tara:strand:+ start:997 stop:1785 length:789 start_codon:yes stop_codon:yes gene_type:complete